MKKRSLSMVLLVVLVTLLTVVPVFAGSVKTAPVKFPKSSIRLNKSLVTVEVGKSVKLTVTVKGKSKNVVWYSNNKKVATVKNGIVTGKKEGYAVVMAKANCKTAKCLVMVEKAKTQVKDLYDYSAYVGKTTTFAQLRKEMPWLKFSTEDRSSDDEGVAATLYKLSDGYMEFLSGEYPDNEYPYTYANLGENDLPKITCLNVKLRKYKEGYCIKGIYPGMSLAQVKKILSKQGYIFRVRYNTTSESKIIYKKADDTPGDIECIFDRKSLILKTVETV